MNDVLVESYREEALNKYKKYAAKHKDFIIIISNSYDMSVLKGLTALELNAFILGGHPSFRDFYKKPEVDKKALAALLSYPKGKAGFIDWIKSLSDKFTELPNIPEKAPRDKAGYTAVNFKEFASLKTKRSKMLYLFLCKWMTGRLKSDCRKAICISKLKDFCGGSNYSDSDFMKKWILPGLESIRANPKKSIYWSNVKAYYNRRTKQVIFYRDKNTKEKDDDLIDISSLE